MKNVVFILVALLSMGSVFGQQVPVENEKTVEMVEQFMVDMKDAGVERFGHKINFTRSDGIEIDSISIHETQGRYFYVIFWSNNCNFSRVEFVKEYGRVLSTFSYELKRINEFKGGFEEINQVLSLVKVPG
ncbi:hypothetical protein HN954_00040 [bacterium]|jgi:hypothetical protein|nr:hypothetical protein [bacterium]MBT6832026.1 hypothetical protein [bacterium]MBT6995807.1 hypothetical protein [bacterium]MBT7772382.1 hypothetical protein [bacterium]